MIYLKPIYKRLAVIIVAFLALSSLSFSQNITEIHYDNSGGDVDEGVEVYIPAGYTSSSLQLVAYNGNGGTSYSTTNVTFTTSTDEQYIWVPITGLQNGAPDGIALVADGIVIEFLSYEGDFTATDGPAIGVTSTDIGVIESGTTPIGSSLQLIDGTWQAADQTPGAANSSPSVCPTITSITAPAEPCANVPFDLEATGLANLLQTENSDQDYGVDFVIHSGSTIPTDPYSPISVLGSGTVSGTSATLTGTALVSGTYQICAILNPVPSDATCRPSACTTVNVSDNLTVSITGNLSVCGGGSTTMLTASGGNTYVWSSGETTPSITATGGSYTVTVTDANGCTNSTTATVTVNAGPTVGLTTMSVCPNENSEFTATPAGASDYIFFTDTDANGMVDPGELLQMGTDETYTVELNDGDEISVQVTDANGCSGVATATAMVSTEVEVTGSTTCVNGTANAGFSEFFVTFSATGGTAPYEYSYVSSDAGETATMSNWDGMETTVGVFTNSQDGKSDVVTVTVTDASGCTGVVEINETICGFDPTGDDVDTGDPLDDDQDVHSSGFVCNCDGLSNAVAILAQSDPNSYTAGGTSGFSQVYILADVNDGYITAEYDGFFNGAEMYDPITNQTTGLTEGMYTVYAVNGVDADVQALLASLSMGDDVSDAVAAVTGCVDGSCTFEFDIDCGCCRPNAGVLSTTDCTSFCSNPDTGESTGADVVCVDVDFSNNQDRDPALGYEYVFAIVNTDSRAIEAMIDPATQYDEDGATTMGAFANCEPVTIPAGLAPGTYSIYGISYNPNMMIFNGLPAVGDDIDAWSMGVQEMDNDNTLTNVANGMANNGMTVLENGYALDCADISTTGFLDIEILEPLAYTVTPSCTDAAGNSVPGEWYIVVDAGMGGFPDYEINDNKNPQVAAAVAYTSGEMYVGPYTADVQNVEITLSDNNSSNASCNNCEISMVVVAPTLPTAVDPAFTICANTDEYQSYDLTQHDGTVGATIITWYDGQPSNGGTLITDATDVDLSASPDLWAVNTDFSGCATEIDVTYTVIQADCGSMPAWDGQNDE